MTPPTDEARACNCATFGNAYSCSVHTQGDYVAAAEARTEQTVGPRTERVLIERRARLQDAYDALRAAVLWLHGEYRDRDRNEFDAVAWHHKARSGNIGLRDYLAAIEREAAPALDPERLARAAARYGIAVQDYDGSYDLDMEWAEWVAAEYARLSQPSPDEPEDDLISDSRQPEDGPPPGRWPR